ncbi:MAG: hypothetical protein ACXACY_26740, partial [Candidatus Hodarchaeales archaeon]
MFHSDWDIEKAGILISNSENGKVLDIIKQRMEGYIKNISEKGTTAQERSLFKNLPAEYHTLLKSAIARFKQFNVSQA